MVSSKQAISRIQATAKMNKNNMKGKRNGRIQGIYQIKTNRSKSKWI